MGPLRSLALAASIALFASGPGLADVRSGYDMWNRGDYYGAVKEWRPLAVAGDADAQFNLAQAYKLGRGLPADLKMAEQWYAKAAAQGNQQARDNYGLILFQNGDRQAAMPYIEESAARGEPRAQYVLGTALFNGDNRPKDWVRAYALMTRASASGITAASTSLAQMDKFIPLDQRQRGLTMARTLEETALRPQTAMLGGQRSSNLVGSENLPPSKAVTPAPAPTTLPTPVRTARPAPRPTVMPDRAPMDVGAPPVAVAPRSAPSPAPRPTSGKWRVQLGAFSESARATVLGASLRSRIAALAPYQTFVVNSGAITRLQAGPLASRAAADKLCTSVKAAGQACLPVAI